ncbi:50S ribosomal protein L23 [Candidatus Parcubacteria bacterium]|nr:MAG: 50S ribosomal protein L23 [Candidatus Parcubacteria bacterium]
MRDQLVIRSPWVTEKSTALSETGKYVFMVKPSATKNEIKKAIQEIYRVHPTSVNIVRRQGKQKRFRNVLGRKPEYKKAIITLREGERIDLGR